MKALVVGYGSIGKRHVKNLLTLSNIEIIIFTNRKDKNLKKCKVFNSLEKCLKEEPDFAINADLETLETREESFIRRENRNTTSVAKALTYIDCEVEKI